MESQSFTSMDARTQPFDSSKVYEWLLNNDCPFEWEPINTKDPNSCTLIFTQDKDVAPRFTSPTEDEFNAAYPEPQGEPSY